MGYDSTISVYDKYGKYMGDVIDDVSINSVRDLIMFSKNKQLSDKKLDDLFMFGDINCDVKVIHEFLDSINETEIREDDYSKKWLINNCKMMVENKNIKYFSITSV